MEPFDNRLCDLKLRVANERLHAESGDCWKQAKAEVKQLGNYARFFPSFIECQLEALRKYIEEVDKVVRDVRSLDGNAVSSEFIRTVLVPRVFGVIAARKGAIQHELGLRAMRTGEHSGSAQHYLIQKVSRLQGELANRYEVEAIELGKRRTRDFAASGLSAATAGISLREDASGSERMDRRPGSKADLWRDFHEKFQALAGEEQGRAVPITQGRMLQGMDRVLRAHGDYRKHPEGWEKGKPEQGLICLLHTPPHGVWNLSDGVSENFRARLRALAARAGVALGSPKDAISEDFWLNQLYLDLRENNSELLFAASEESGMIVSVCVASATFCSQLERKAFEQSEPSNRTGLACLSTDANEAESAIAQNGDKVPESSPVSWSEIEIAFLSDERVGICRGADTNRETLNYSELGFEDRRSGKPNRAWVTLREIARQRGAMLQPSAGKDRAMIQKRIEEIRQKLRGHFGIQADPIPFNGNRYQVSFKIDCRPSVET